MILNLKRIGVYMLTAAALVALVVNIATLGVAVGFASLVWLFIFLILFFTLRKSGKSAYQVIFKSDVAQERVA